MPGLSIRLDVCITEREGTNHGHKEVFRSRFGGIRGVFARNGERGAKGVADALTG